MTSKRQINRNHQLAAARKYKGRTIEVYELKPDHVVYIDGAPMDDGRFYTDAIAGIRAAENFIDQQEAKTRDRSKSAV